MDERHNDMTNTPGPEEHTLLHGYQTIEEWWQKNGLDHNEARIKRKATYLEQLKEVSKMMDRYNANATSNKN